MASSEERSNTIEIDSNVVNSIKNPNNIEKNIYFNNENINLNVENGLNNDLHSKSAEITSNVEIIVSQSGDMHTTTALNDRSPAVTNKQMSNTVNAYDPKETDNSSKASAMAVSKSAIITLDNRHGQHVKNHVHSITKPNPIAVSSGLCYGSVTETVAVSSHSRCGSKQKESKNRDNGRLCFIH